ncbi:lytic transglycosylase domain-containing protein [Microvirga sp. CF3062]|uniref:lytic transglycosylase domain-containing protein n=1 Tax=Microvirga sp. CF3062 TaxID=3110182 RepID=UPI002E786687|nr:lytic transglycosylase domain-containing protein [Microvirga sp. CF3062]MEE1657024.1 lytic transglycosylase domain-containing protein [Microvirga sp. CF3062]
MTWKHFLRTLTVAGLGAAALVAASQARANGRENGPISPDQAEQFLGAAAAEAAAFVKEEAAAASTEEAPEQDTKGAGKKKLKEAAASKSSKPQVGKAEETQPELVAKGAALPEGADQQTASLPAVSADAKSRTRISDATRAGALKPLVARYASENGLPYELADAVIRIESRYNAGARNGPHMGLTQINVRTAQSLGYKGDAAGLLDAETNLRYGLKYLATAYKLAGGDTCGTILRYQFGHRTQTMTAASRAYCARVKVITAAAD